MPAIVRVLAITIAGRYDMAVLLTSNVANPELMLELVIYSPRRLWLCAHHPLLKRENVTLADVADEPFVMLTVDEAAYTALRYWNETPYRPKHAVREYFRHTFMEPRAFTCSS